MQFNNWNLALQMCLLYDNALSGNHLLLFRGEAPPLDPAMPAGVAHLTVLARESDWLATYTLSGKIHSTVGGVVRAAIASHDAHLYRDVANVRSADYARLEDSLLAHLLPQSRAVSGPSGEGSLPTWFAIMALDTPTTFPSASSSTAPLLTGIIGGGAADTGEVGPLLIQLLHSDWEKGTPASGGLTPILLPT